MKRRWSWDLTAAAFAALLFFFSLARDRDPLRWSAWAVGDAQNLNAALHFAREGFLTHKFLTYNHPGYLGQHSRNESGLGYEPHYPSLSAGINAVLIRRFGENLFLLKAVAAAFSCLALLLWYAVCAYFFERPVALAALILIGTSVSYLEFVDCLSPYSYSEFFRFAALAAFLYSERFKSDEKPAAAWALLAGAWAFTFLEAMNSNDYILFLQFFFLGYYLLKDRRAVPLGRWLFLVSAAGTAFALRFTQNFLVLGSRDAVSEWTSKSLLSGEKTAPIQKGIGAFLSFWTYFARILEGHMVQSNFGFGFGACFLMMAWVWSRHDDYRNRLFSLNLDPHWSLRRVLVLFLVPSVSWWIVFSNHAASFFYTPRHLYPILGILMAVALTYARRSHRDPRPSVAWAGRFALAGILWSPALFTSKYLKEYPNRIAPQARIQMSDWKDFSTEEIGAWSGRFRALRDLTAYGDAVIVADKKAEFVGDFFEYQAQRRLEFADTVSEFESERKKLEEYRRTGDRRYPAFGPFAIYALTTESTPAPVTARLKKEFPGPQNSIGAWTLWRLESPPRSVRTR